MIFRESNVQAKLAGTKAEAERIVFGCGAAPCYTLVVNAARHPGVDAFLRTAVRMSQVFRAITSDRPDACLVESLLRVVRADIGSSVDLVQLDWDKLDAVLMADSFNRLADVLDEFGSSSS